MDAVRMEESVFLIAEDYMKLVIRIRRVFGAAGGIASGMTNKAIQTAGQYMTLGAALMNPEKPWWVENKKAPSRITGKERILTKNQTK